MTILMTITPTSVPDIADNAVEFGGADALSRFPPVREYIDTFEFSATFSGVIDEVTLTAPELTITNVEISPTITGIVSTFSGNTINISGIASNVFLNKYYQFKMNDESIKILPPNTVEDFYGVIKYQPDYVRYVEITYFITFSVMSTDPLAPGLSTSTYVAMQTVNNDWEANRLILKQLVAQGH